MARRWTLAHLHTGPKWLGGERLIKIAVDYSQSRLQDDQVFYWVRITAKFDPSPHLKQGTMFFCSERMIEPRDQLHD